MKKVKFTARCSGIGSVYNAGDTAVFPDSVADAIVSAKKGTAEPFEPATAAKAAAATDKSDDGSKPPADDAGKQK
ncbi:MULTISPECIES: hypothetical protein [Acetobacter]|uniref:hypothetical protein n=1 Tax=Acetobacter TaxID=434 RepID=UPI000777BA0A|nr:hypothetical protein [Acetobacter malorum]